MYIASEQLDPASSGVTKGFKMAKKLLCGGVEYTVIPDGGARGEESWYLSNPIQNGDRLELARVLVWDGCRYPTHNEMVREGITNRYVSSKDFTGERVLLMVGLTAEEIKQGGFAPTGTSPEFRRMVTPAEAQAAVDHLCNEGWSK